MNCNKKDVLERDGVRYTVVCADEEIFVIAPLKGDSANFLRLEAYSNDSTVCSLEDLKFRICNK